MYIIFLLLTILPRITSRGLSLRVLFFLACPFLYEWMSKSHDTCLQPALRLWRCEIKSVLTSRRTYLADMCHWLFMYIVSLTSDRHPLEDHDQRRVLSQILCFANVILISAGQIALIPQSILIDIHSAPKSFWLLSCLGRKQHFGHYSPSPSRLSSSTPAWVSVKRGRNKLVYCSTMFFIWRFCSTQF